jgi:hypothetical protein
LSLALFDQARNSTTRVALNSSRVWLRAECDFLTEQARFSYSTDGQSFQSIGEPFTMIFQLTTFQGVRYALFAYNTGKQQGGMADFDSIDIQQPHPRGLMRAIPYEQRIQLKPATGRAPALPLNFTVQDMGLGRVALRAGDNYLGVGLDGGVTLQAARPGVAHSFQWMETPTGELILMSLLTNFYLRVHPQSGALLADSPGPIPDGSDGVRFLWNKQ